MQEILGLVRRCVTDYDMIQEGETVAVGVSGGKDSLVTLTALARLSKFYQKPFKVVAITVETGVPGMSFDAWSTSAWTCRSTRSSFWSARKKIPARCAPSSAAVRFRPR